jgi:hypothetical protein
MEEGTKSEKWAPPGKGKMSRIYEERSRLRAEVMHWRGVAFVIEALTALDLLKEPRPRWVSADSAPLERFYALVGHSS